MTQENQTPAEIKACCASLYDSEAARLMLGDSLHPGGLGLTHRLGRMAALQPGKMVLDVACGRGASARALARSFKCRVVGLDLSRYNLLQASSGAENGGQLSFLLADGEALPFADGAFDAVFCECSMSLFPDKQRAAQAMARCLRPGGRVALSDVTVEPGALPQELGGMVGQMLCLTDALPADGYRRLLEGAGLEVVETFDATSTILGLLEEIKGKLGGLLLLQAFTGLSGDFSQLLSQAGPLIDEVKAQADEGDIGYWLFVAEKSS